METQPVYNILVTNIDPNVTVEALTTFFSFTGNVIAVRLSDASDGTKIAIISFDNEESVKTAELMSGATLEKNRITIEQTTMTQQSSEENVYIGESLPQRTIPELPQQHTKTSVAASLLARGYILASDTFQKAVEFDKQHNITSSIKAGAQKVKEAAIEVDEKLHFTEYLALGLTYVNSVITHVDEKYEVSKTVSSAISTASQKVDETLHISQGVEIAKGAIQNGVEKVKNSQPVVALRNQTNTFKEDVKSEIQSRRQQDQNELNENNIQEGIIEEQPFELNEENVDVNVVDQTIQSEMNAPLEDNPIVVTETSNDLVEIPPEQ